MDKLIAMALAPYALFVMLLIAWPFKRAVERMKDCRLKRFLLIRWGDRPPRWMARLDEFIYSTAHRIERKVIDLVVRSK